MSDASRLPRRRFGAWLARWGAAAWAVGGAPGAEAASAAAGFPERPITLVVPFAPGGIADLTARAVAESMARTLGQPVVVDNRPSAGSIVASQLVAAARPDGHTLLLMSNSHALSVSLFRKLPVDPLRDFAPISTLGSFDLGVFAPPGSRWGSLRDALAMARAQPGKLTLGTIAVGSTQHLAAKWLETLAGVDALVVPYKGTPAVLTALRAGEIDLAVEILGPMLPHLRGGAVKALAVSSQRRHPLLPEVPTAQEQGVDGWVVASWNALAAPAGTSPAVIDALNRAVRAALASPEVVQRLGPLGLRPMPGSPIEMRALLESEIRRWGQVIREARIEAE